MTHSGNTHANTLETVTVSGQAQLQITALVANAETHPIAHVLHGDLSSFTARVSSNIS